MLSLTSSLLRVKCLSLLSISILGLFFGMMC